MEKISIITINRNNASGLSRTIKSVISQLNASFEFIVIDGASTDESQNIIKENADKIDYWVSEKDSGIYDAMNKGILAATGEYCLFLNSGDWLENEFSLSRVNVASFSSDFIGFDFIYWQEGKRTSREMLPDKIRFSRFYFGSISHPSTFIRRELFSKYGLYNTENYIISDWEFFLKCFFIYHCTYEHIGITLSVFAQGGISSSRYGFEQMMKERKAVMVRYFPLFIDDYEELRRYRVSLLGKIFSRLR